MFQCTDQRIVGKLANDKQRVRHCSNPRGKAAQACHYLPFDLPEVPKVGDYIFIFRPDPETHTEDVIVRHVCWPLGSPEDPGIVSRSPSMVGMVRDILVECEVALGRYARDSWRVWADAAKVRGTEVVAFHAGRSSVPDSES